MANSFAPKASPPATRRLIIDGRRLTAARTGVGRYLETLLRDWSATGWPLDETVVVLQHPEGVARLPRDARLRVEVVGARLPGLAWEWLGLGRVLKPGDVLFAPTNLLPIHWRGTSVLIVFDTLLESVPESFPRTVRWRFRSRYRLSARRATRVIVPSEATARDVVRHYGVDPSRVRTIYPAIGHEFRPRSPEDGMIVAARWAVGVGEAPYFLFVGKRSRRRNVGAVVDGFTRHYERFPSHRLVFAGPAGGVEVPAHPAIVVAGHVTDDVLLGLMAGAVACLYPSDHEGFGLPLVEAMASGCPVVTLRNSALVESGGDAAVYLERAEAGEIATAIGRLAEDHSLSEALVGSGLGQARKFRGSGFAEAVREEIRSAAGLVPAAPGG
ncbi:MAG TPA: glycosyltransferase family 1 protein [Isosphaeraceae bacterium]